MAIAEELKTKENKTGGALDFGDWLLLFLGSVFVDIIFVLIAVIGLIPLVGQVFYAFLDPILNASAAFGLWIYLQFKGLGGYWYLAFGGGLAGLVPVINWFSWTLGIMILYFLVKAEAVPLAGEAISKAVKAASKIK